MSSPTMRRLGWEVSARTAARIAWGTAAVIFVCSAATLVLQYLNRSALAFDDATNALGVLPLATLAGLGGLIASRQPKNLIGWILLGAIGSFAVNSLTTQTAIRGQLAGASYSGWATWIGWFSNWSWPLFFPAGLTVLFFLLLPDGKLPGRRWRWLVWVVLLSAPALMVFSALDATPIQLAPHLPHLENPIGQRWLGVQGGGIGSLVLPLLGVIPLLLTVVAMVLRLIRSRGDERQQLKWIVYGSATVIVAIVVDGAAQAAGLDRANFGNLIGPLGLGVVLPACFGVAILKYGLYEIDVVISRTLVYGSLAAFITAVYVGIVVGIGSVIGSGGRPNLGLSIFATAVVAVGFQPLRDRLQKFANRLVYGKRATPYEVLSQFSERVAESYDRGDVLQRMAQVLQEGTGAESATVWLRTANQLARAATHPDTIAGYELLPLLDGELPVISSASRVVAVRHQDELLGALTLINRQGEALTPIEEGLLADLAHQAGLVLKNVGLTTDLQARLEELRASRQRLVAAQDDERRRLERNLHDGAQQNLVAIKVKLGLVEMVTAKDPQKARELITALKADTDEALETLRDLARGIYPPLLADQGLEVALQAQARKATVPVVVQGDGVGRYPQEVEAAVYFCVLEALQNVQKYAGATSVAVRLSELEGQLLFEVHDDGRGFDRARVVPGAGLTNMGDRLDALGGKLMVTSELRHFTRVSGSLPLPAAAAKV